MDFPESLPVHVILFQSKSCAEVLNWLSLGYIPAPNSKRCRGKWASGFYFDKVRLLIQAVSQIETVPMWEEDTKYDISWEILKKMQVVLEHNFGKKVLIQALKIEDIKQFSTYLCCNRNPKHCFLMSIGALKLWVYIVDCFSPYHSHSESLIHQYDNWKLSLHLACRSVRNSCDYSRAPAWKFHGNFTK